MTAPTPAREALAAWTLADLRIANIERQAAWCPEQVPDLSFRGNELGGEAGEAQNVIKKLERERHGWRGSRATLDDLAQELADVVICADLVGLTAGLDLMAAVKAKFDATSEKVGLPHRLSPTALRLPADAGPGVEEIARALWMSDNPGEDAFGWDQWLDYIERFPASSTLQKDVNACRRRARAVAALSPRPAPASEVREPLEGEWDERWDDHLYGTGLGRPGYDPAAKPLTSSKPDGIVERLRAHAGFMENGGCAEHSMTDEPGLLREATATITRLEGEIERLLREASDNEGHIAHADAYHSAMEAAEAREAELRKRVAELEAKVTPEATS